MIIYQKNIIALLTLTACWLGVTSCKKLVAIDEPNNTITTVKIFQSESQAKGALAGIYTRMIHGNDALLAGDAARNIFSAGLTTFLCGMSGDEINNSVGVSDPTYYVYSANRLTINESGPSNLLWTTAYLAIYSANSIIEGVEASTSASLTPDIRTSLIAEAKFIRAFCYFYLTNYFGDVPLALTVDFNKTALMPRTPKQQVYQQIEKDLLAAETGLAATYSTGTERVRPNKWTATALLARVYLYLEEYDKAAAAATTVINNQEIYQLEPDINRVFLTDSKEAIWQLQQNTSTSSLKNATPEGLWFLPSRRYIDGARVSITNELLNAFEPGDKRREDWVDSTTNANTVPVRPMQFYPAKYKTGSDNGQDNAPATEYYMVFRLAELYLVRAEATARGASGGHTAAINDLNRIRNRAGLPNIPASSTKDQVIAAVAQERRIELFAEWGHRWFDLRRTGKAEQVLSVMPAKQPWRGPGQLLYPIPVTEIQADPFLVQNPGY